MISFEDFPTTGTVVMLDKQAFELVGTKPHKKADGSTTTLLLWAANCSSCNAPFNTSSPLRTNGLNRRCPSCARPGRPVNGKRGRAVKVKVVEA